jgi:hypothetical protein
MTKTFIIATGELDSDNDRIISEGLKLKDPATKVFKNFNYSELLGHASNLEIKDGKLKATVKFKDGFDPVGKYPAMGFNILKYRIEGEVRVIEEFKLWCIGICDTENADKTVPPIT